MSNISKKKYLCQFGFNLKKIRIEKNLTQADLANDANIPINQLGRIERGEINTTLGTLLHIAEALDFPLKQLFDFEKTENE